MMIYILGTRNYFGLGVDYRKFSSAKEALDFAIGQGKWAGEEPYMKFSIAGPYNKPPSIEVLTVEMTVAPYFNGPG